MAEEMKVVIVNREIIKPSSPTPPNLKTYNLSFFDQISPNLNVSVLLFYPFDKDHALYDKEIDKKSQRLKSSLSKTLTRFYPFAGRIKDNVSIECNDEGAIFIEARVHGVLDLVGLEKYISKNLQFISNIDLEEQEKGNHLLQVQANFFECGGLVISLSMSHKLADASTVSTFINAWSATALNYPDDVYPVCFADFSLPSIIPAVKPPSLPQLKLSTDQSKLEVKRYVFSSAKMSLLKEKAISEGVKKPTRVECVCSLLWKCLMDAPRSRLGIETPSIFIQVVNLRRRTIPPLPSNSFGNMLTTFTASREETKSTNLNDLILNLRRGLHEIGKTERNRFKEEETILYFLNKTKEMRDAINRDDTCTCSCSSWCNFPFYEAHFGWGKPTWVCPYSPPFKNLFVLMDTRDGHGIEAWCSLIEDDVDLLEQNEEFLKFAQT